ncbi:MAG TPA: ABC transporter ATP-binding protein, partial [Burkholderiaceae bacterium]|nr:ABC transporter ATP-binding protein [Burkholderiaceae bacterium]
MTEPLAIRASGLSKCYQIYDRPQDRLWQGLMRGRRRFYREFWALRETSFELRRGETVGVIGRNGSGKSTLLQIICGTLTPTTGTLEVNGRISALLELGSGFNPDFTGRENVYLNGAIHGLSSAQVDARFDEIAAFADIGEFIDQPVKTYSSGMYARLAFSSAIFVDPDILVIDEILAVGDAPFQAKCIQAFHRLRDRGCTILLVSHDAYMIRNFCQRALYLRKGECMGFGDSSEVIEAYNLEIETAMAPKAAPAAAAPDAGGAVAAGGAPADATTAPPGDLTVLSLFRITGVELLAASGAPPDPVATGSTMAIRFASRPLSPNPPPVT